MSLTYADAIKYLYELQLFGASLNLERPAKLAKLAGSPHEKLRFVHVAGTNGKGSVCAMLASVYRAAGMKVGLFTSPHLVRFGERIQVNGKPISEAHIIQQIKSLREVLKTFPKDENHPTFFEVLTVMAMRHFADEKCDIVILETGLGGRYDATNIVTPLASVITNVALDHCQWLGDTVAKIAHEKAGIIKPGIPALTATDEPEALAVVSEIARCAKAPLTVVKLNEITHEPIHSAKLALHGAHQKLNAALAAATVRQLAETIPVTDAQLVRGLEAATLLGRFQIVNLNGRTFVLDGAHNPAGAQATAATFHEQFPGRKPLLIIGVMQDKNVTGICEVLAPLSEEILATASHSPRSLEPSLLKEHCRAANSMARVDTSTNMQLALNSLTNENLVLISGSLEFIGEALEHLEIEKQPEADEHALNDYHRRHEN